jgi:hypothetical protein
MYLRGGPGGKCVESPNDLRRIKAWSERGLPESRWKGNRWTQTGRQVRFDKIDKVGAGGIVGSGSFRLRKRVPCLGSGR